MRYRWELAAQQARLLEQLEVLHQEYRMLVGEPSAHAASRWTFLTEINRVLVLLGSARDAADATELAKLRHRVVGTLEVIDRLRTQQQTAGQPSVATDALDSFLQRLHRLAEGEGNLLDLREPGSDWRAKWRRRAWLISKPIQRLWTLPWER